MNQQLKITVLGCGTSSGVPLPGCNCAVCTSVDPKNKRLRASILLQHRSPSGKVQNILFDTSTDLRQQALSYGFSRLDAVFYTHAHADHIFGLDDLRLFNFVQGGRIPLYASEETASSLERIFRYCFVPDFEYEGGALPQLDLFRITPFVPLVFAEGLELLPIPVKHGSLEVMACRCGDFAYITDCSEIPPDSLKALQGVRVLIIDGLRERPHRTHFTISQAAEAAQQIGATRTYLTHMSHELDYTAGNEKLLSLGFDSVQLAFDGLTLEL